MDMYLAQELVRLRPQLVRFAMRRLQDRALAEDAVQETLLAALEGIERFGSASSLRTWATGILKHKIVDSMRASGREVALDLDNAESPATGPEQGLTRTRLIEILERSLKRLPQAAARVFVMRALMGADTAEICERLGISRTNCWVLHHRARVRLRECPEIRGLAADAL